jgi:phosphoglycolate phosphatase-like HAD superfamily hydrolase
MEPLLVLFDVDGTLIDTAGAGRRAIERAFERVHAVDLRGGRPDGVRYAGMTDPIIFRNLGLALGVDERRQRERWAELLETYLAALEDEMERSAASRRVLPGVPELLEALSGRHGIYLGLLTGNLEAGARIKLSPFGLNRYFSGGGFASDHPERPEIARLARDKLSRAFDVRFSSDRVVVVGDTEHDVTCARANGFRAVAVESGWVPREDLQRSNPDALFEDLSDLAATMRALGIDDP